MVLVISCCNLYPCSVRRSRWSRRGWRRRGVTLSYTQPVVFSVTPRGLCSTTLRGNAHTAAGMWPCTFQSTVSLSYAITHHNTYDHTLALASLTAQFLLRQSQVCMINETWDDRFNMQLNYDICCCKSRKNTYRVQNDTGWFFSLVPPLKVLSTEKLI